MNAVRPSALTAALAQTLWPTLRGGAYPPEVACFMERRMRGVSDWMRPPLALLSRTFDVAAMARHGRPFHSLSPEQRRRCIERWERGAFGFQRDFVRLHQTLTAFAPGEPRPPALAPEIAPPGQILRSPPDELRAEIVVIGSGPGGSITACLLAEAGRDVILLEEGPALALESTSPFSADEMELKYRNGGLTVALGADKISYAEGRCVGGGSEINSGLYHRAPGEIVDAWRRDLDIADFSPEALGPLYAAGERDLDIGPPHTEPAPAGERLRKGAERLGWRSLDVESWLRRDPGKEPGSRGTMTKTYLPRFFQARGRLLPDTRVHRLRREGGAWSIEAASGDGQRMRLRADVVFVCGGAIQTPALLRRSGFGHNIGRSLACHPTLKVVAQFPFEINGASAAVPVHQVKQFAPRLSFGCSLSQPGHLAVGLIDHPQARSDLAQMWRRRASYYVALAGEGRGSVDVLPGFRDPVVRYRITPRDHADLAEGFGRLMELLRAAGAEAIYPSAPGLPGRSWENATTPLSLPPRLSGLSTVHLFGSCPMGESDARTAVDSFGRVHGQRNLYVSDASLFGGPPGVNPQGTIMALARRNALHFLGRSL